MARVGLHASVLCVVVALAGCHATYPSAPSTPSIVALQVHFLRAMGPVPVSSSFGLIAYAVDSDDAYEDVTGRVSWSTSDASIISRGAPGVISFGAIGAGTATITAQYQGFSTTVTVVTIRADRPVYPSLVITGGDARSVGTAAPAVARLQRSPSDTQDVTALASWSSSDPRVATVAADGMVRAHAPGTAQITASYSGLSTWYNMSVSPAR